MQTALKNLKASTTDLLQLASDQINHTLRQAAQTLIKHTDDILAANQQDLERMDESDPKYDRLKLTSERIKAMAGGLEQLATLDSPVGEAIEQRRLKNGLQVSRIRVPIGVIGMIYEARPNVTTDAWGIAFKTQNAIALKGGSDAQFTNQAVFALIQQTLTEQGLNPDTVFLLPPDRAATKELMEAVGLVDVIIPRGSQGLIKFVRDTAKVPVIETGAGIVHTYWDESGRADYAQKIVLSAKTRRPSVCNALDTLLVHEQNLDELPSVLQPLAEHRVQVWADQASLTALEDQYPAELLAPAQPEHYGTEFLGYQLSVKTVTDLDEALTHIARYSSGHSEAIITQDKGRASHFLNLVDAACVFVNTETGYSDGEELGLGAEIGISTQNLHARAPMALEAMTSYKWVIEGTGQTRI